MGPLPTDKKPSKPIPKGIINVVKPKAKDNGRTVVNVKVNHLHAVPPPRAMNSYGRKPDGK